MIQLRGHDAFDQPPGAAEVGKVVELRVHFEGGADRLASWVAEQVCGEKEGQRMRDQAADVSGAGGTEASLGRIRGRCFQAKRGAPS